MTGHRNSGAVLTGKRRRADSCDATAAPVAEGEQQYKREVKRQRSRTRHEAHDTRWKPVPHPELWPVGHPPSTMEPAVLANSPGDGGSSHMHYDIGLSHHASRVLGAGSLATPATSPPSQGVLSSIDDCDDVDMDQDMDEDDDDDESDINPNSEYYSINMLLKRLHDEREMRRQQRHATNPC
ncbi:hypothetical protein GGH94_005467 [Coemansia aciculifera]|uniref:Uncharacterized protein n=1 Tax=Coemansia aciculifera TaxID=417176 RepID=A0A9W8M3V0_9FUNG|nr:hypothetical protein GGH94_005467 [Coemansia aciculifera]